ncbi:hypothetical protein [Streptomyces reniochalinae]|nr:hypothetical protein [Streptomyces reniochalinae]
MTKAWDTGRMVRGVGMGEVAGPVRLPRRTASVADGLEVTKRLDR